MNDLTIDKYTRFVVDHWGHHGLDCALFGLAGEAGEACDLRKKEFHGIERDVNKMDNEVADILFYIVAYCLESGTTLYHLMDINMDKLNKRYPNGFVNGGGIR